ncbi:hypothetical protein AC480_01795 [miscellaneous Crenarchaeota group archaeon SMTZ1-55]|nr:MAG: hypothetical protein AC480_01795 [miscellaneous Crenarchaeota group archaeon SMTZ1-55]
MKTRSHKAIILGRFNIDIAVGRARNDDDLYAFVTKIVRSCFLPGLLILTILQAWKGESDVAVTGGEIQVVPNL